jgi:hypothetical protein
VKKLCKEMDKKMAGRLVGVDTKIDGRGGHVLVLTMAIRARVFEYRCPRFYSNG